MPLPSWKKVLIVDLGFLGDTVHSIPAIRALSMGGAEVDVMTTPVGSEVLSMVTEVHRVWVIPLRKPSPPWWQGLDQLRQIRRQNYDCALTFSGADRNFFCVAFSGAQERIAAMRRERWWHGLLPLTKTISTPLNNRPLFRQKMEILKALGWPGDALGLSIKISAKTQNKDLSSFSQPTVYLSVSAYGSPHKEWPLKSWAEMIRSVREKKPEIKFLVGFAPNQREEDRARELAQLVGNSPSFQVLDTPHSLAELALILRQTVCFAGLDSGLLHLAIALGRPTVSIFRDYTGKSEWAPEGQTHRVLSRLCSCHRDQVDRCGEQPLCLAAVTPQEVADAMLELLPLSN